MAVYSFAVAVLLATTTVVQLALSEEEAEYVQCMIHEVCVEPSGYHNTMNCYNRLSIGDRKHMQSFFEDYYKDKLKPFTKALDAACADTDEAKIAINKYYDERQSETTSREITPEDEKLLVEARNCMLSLVESCELKKQMGMLD